MPSTLGSNTFGGMFGIQNQIIKIIKERIYSLIHFNCPTDLNCQQCINIPQSPAIIELKSAVYQTLDKVSEHDQEFKTMLVNDPNIIPHLIPHLILFVSQSQFNKKFDSQEQHDQQQPESSSSLSLITSSITLLERLINNNSNNRKIVINTPNALHSLCPLSSYKLNIHFSQENDLQTLQVRHNSRECLLRIQLFGDLSAHSELVNARYARVLVIAISTAGGTGEEQYGEIYDGLSRISDFLRVLNKGTYSFPPQPLLAHISNEQIEEEGGNEEVEAQLINKWDYDGIKIWANEAKRGILNYFIEQGNTKPNWY
ncbi:MAG: hypothetical protein EZS28_007380 [Streblomastix strix]|uniref:Uncharacterized protein n=1 Tax=Streblomastix strix TaxID=222440 RepID=A0A5J4WQ46_9EUKA|nr:MAG: hypothetical protein EZS28_007380 [Streblomastix strix]